MCEKLIKSIKKLKEILGKDGEYSISRSDGEKMSLPEMIMVGNIFENIDNALRKEFPWLKSRIPSLWTRSKFVSTVGAVSLDVVKRYIEEQKGK